MTDSMHRIPSYHYHARRCGQTWRFAYTFHFQWRRYLYCCRKSGRQFFITGHAEYDRDTLANEYYRDEVRGLNPELPENYFPDDDRRAIPHFMWEKPCKSSVSKLVKLLCISTNTVWFKMNLITLEKPQKKILITQWYNGNHKNIRLQNDDFGCSLCFSFYCIQ